LFLIKPIGRYHNTSTSSVQVVGLSVKSFGFPHWRDQKLPLQSLTHHSYSTKENAVSIKTNRAFNP